MVDLTVHSFDGEGTTEMEVEGDLFTTPFHNDLLYRAVRTYRANKRAGTANTKTRAEVKGSNRKPWRQKGTGRARHGSRQSPLWVGGGITFRPKPKEQGLEKKKKMKHKAMKSALSARYEEGSVRVIDHLNYEQPSTKEGLALLDRLDLPDKLLIILAQTEQDWRIEKTFSNIPNVQCLPASRVNVYSILKHEGVLVTEEALKELERHLQT